MTRLLLALALVAVGGCVKKKPAHPCRHTSEGIVIDPGEECTISIDMPKGFLRDQ